MMHMNGLQLWKNKDDEEEKIEPTNVIARGYTVPDELMETLLAAAEKKEQEQAKKAEKKAAHKSVALRAAVIAAVITLMILVIPSSRQVVVSAAERIWDFVGELINPLYDVYAMEPGAYYLENGKGTATVNTQELHAPAIDFSDFDYESYPKAVDCKIKSDDLTISLGEITIVPSGYYYDFWINECSLQYAMKDKFSQLTYTMGEGLEYEDPDYYFCHLSYTSNVEVVFLRNDKPLFRVKYLIGTEDNSQTEKTNKLNYSAELLPWQIIWTDEEVEKRFDTDETDDLISIKEMVQQLKPDKPEIASVSINIDEYTDLKAVASEDKMKQLEKEGYNCIDGVDDCCIMCRFNTNKSLIKYNFWRIFLTAVYFLLRSRWARGLLSMADFTCALDRCV